MKQLSLDDLPADVILVSARSLLTESFISGTREYGTALDAWYQDSGFYAFMYSTLIMQVGLACDDNFTDLSGAQSKTKVGLGMGPHP